MRSACNGKIGKIGKIYILTIFCQIVSRAKVVLHLFKKPLFSGSIGNAIAFNTSIASYVSHVISLEKSIAPRVCRSRAEAHEIISTHVSLV